MVLISSVVVHATPLQTTDPVFDAIPYIAARTGIIVTLETAPDTHRRTVVRHQADGTPILRTDGSSNLDLLDVERYPFELELPAPRADAAQAAIEALVEAARTWAHADGCTSYAVTQTALGFHVAPTRVMKDGQCIPYESPLEVTLAPEGGMFRGDTMINALFKEHDLIVVRPYGELRVPPGGLTAREVLDMLIAPAGNATWCVGPSGSHIKLEESGSVSLTGLDLADYPFHPEHARRERERSMPPEVRARLDEMAKEHEELMSEWDRLRALGLSQDEANARLLEQELERDRIEGGD